jgi:hypothetical protein
MEETKIERGETAVFEFIIDWKIENIETNDAIEVQGHIVNYSEAFCFDCK